MIVATVVLRPGSRFTICFSTFVRVSDYTCIHLGCSVSSLYTRPKVLSFCLARRLACSSLSLASPEFTECPLRNCFLSWHKIYQCKQKLRLKLTLLLFYNFIFNCRSEHTIIFLKMSLFCSLHVP